MLLDCLLAFNCLHSTKTRQPATLFHTVDCNFIIYICAVLNEFMRHFTFLIGFILLIFAGCKNTTDNPADKPEFSEIEQLSKEIADSPNNPQLYMQRARFFYEKSSYDNAITDMKKAISLDSLNPALYHFLTDCYLDSGNGQEAVNTMFKVLAMYPERVPSLLKTAEVQYILEKYDESILTINQAVKVDPHNAECFFMLGVNFRALQDIPRAINSFQTAVEMDSKLTDAWLMLGELMEAKKDPKALQYFESAVLSDPTSPHAKHALAYYLQNHKNIPRALELYRNIIVEHKDYIDAYLNSGILYMEMDSLDRAYEQFNLITGVSPQNAQGYFFRGKVEKERGNLKAALADLQTANNLDSSNPIISRELEAIKAQFNSDN